MLTCAHPVFLLPFPLLRVLDLKRRSRYGLILTFALGMLTIITSATRFIRIQTGTDWDRLGPSLHLVHGRNVHSHHGRFNACTEIPTEVLEVLFELALYVSKQLL